MQFEIFEIGIKTYSCIYIPKYQTFEFKPDQHSVIRRLRLTVVCDDKGQLLSYKQ